MDPTTDVKQMRDALMSRVDEQLAHTYEQIKSADEQLARMENQLSRQGRESPPDVRPQRPKDRAWLRGTIGLLLAACIVAAALLSRSPHAGIVERWAPQLVSALAVPKLLVQLAAADPPAHIAPNGTTSTAVSAYPEPTKALETMARDLADLERKIEMLNAMVTDNANAVEQIQASQASQEQVVREIARNTELLRASQEQLANLVATTSQQNLPSRTSAPQPPAAMGTRKPLPTPPLSHASAPPQVPAQLRPEQR